MRNLLNFLIKNNHWFLFILLEVTSVVLLFQRNNYQGSVWFSSANVIAGKLYEWDSRFMQYFSMLDANKELANRNINLERQVTELRNRVYDLENQTGVKANDTIVRPYKVIEAKVVSNSVSNIDNYITIDKGEKDGVKQDMGVVSGNGVVGVVYMTSPSYSIVIPILNPRTNISCRIRNTHYFGTLNWDGKDPTIAYLENLPRHAKLVKGCYIETSGYSSIFPEGVLVGKAIAAYNSKDGLSYRLKVHLSTDFGCLRDVFVINEEGLSERARLMQAAQDSLKQKSVF